MKKQIISFLFLFNFYFTALNVISAESLYPSNDKTAVLIKTNLLSGAFLSPSLGVEFPIVNDQWSIELSGEINQWDAWDDQKWQHWNIRPTLRYWLSESFDKWSVEVHLLGGQFDFGHLTGNIPTFYGKFSDMIHFRYDGYFMGGGFGLGYDWQFCKYFTLSAELGVGYLYMNADKYRCFDEHDLVRRGEVFHYFGLTKAAVNIAYRFLKQRRKVETLQPRRTIVQEDPVEEIVAEIKKDPTESVAPTRFIDPVEEIVVPTVPTETVMPVISNDTIIIDFPVDQNVVPVVDEIRLTVSDNDKTFHPVFVYLGLDDEEGGMIGERENNKSFRLLILNTVELNPDDESANLNAANIYLSQGNLSEARRHLGRAGYSKEAAYARGIYYALMGNYSESLASLRVAEEAKIKHATEMIAQIKALQQGKN